VTGDRDERAAYVRSLRVQVEADAKAEVKDHVALELIEELLPYLGARADPPPALTARLFRFYTDTGDLELAKRHRDNLHLHAEAGDTVAIEVLALLSDDPFWRAS
jgi:hypothetical protein